MKYDLGIIGFGPGGQKAALLAKKAGLSVIIFEKNRPGGTCLNLGCIPTKSILHDSQTKDFKYAVERQKKIKEKLNSAIEHDFKNKGIEIVYGEAKIVCKNNKPEIECDNKIYETENVIISTGSKPYELPDLKFDNNFIISSDDIFKMQTLPKSIAIIGSGAIGVEWARIFNNFGVEVRIIELASHLLPNMDIDISKRLERIFRMKKIKFYPETKVEKVSSNKIKLSNGEEFETEKILVAVGRKKVMPEIKGVEEFEIRDDFTTSIPNVFAIGDITNNPMLAHCASYEANIVINKIFKSKELKLNKNEIPSVVYGTPEIASIGLREQDINPGEYKILNLPISFLPKSWCDDNIDGFIKLITKDNFVCGAHIISNEASALIVQIAIIMKGKLTLDKIKEIIFPHPTYSEGILEAIENGD